MPYLTATKGSDLDHAHVIEGAWQTMQIRIDDALITDEIGHGHEEYGQHILLALREHILVTGEAKSYVHLLPNIEAALDGLLVPSRF